MAFSILVIGAGKSSKTLIQYLGNLCEKEDANLLVADPIIELAHEKINNFPKAKALSIDVLNATELEQLIKQVDYVVSMVPAFLHIHIAKACIKLSKHLFTASYVSEEIKNLHQEALEKNITILMECGLDPGIDHISALSILEKLKEKGAMIKTFKSFCGGLVAPESDTNSWHYKFSWNPRNVILAGQSTSQYLLNGEVFNVPYHQLFKNVKQFIISEKEIFEGYPNRNSLPYIETYQLNNEVENFVRGTLRGENFCKAWACLVDLGLTDNSILVQVNNRSWKEFMLSFVPNANSESIIKNTADYLKLSIESTEIKMLTEAGIFSDEQIPFDSASPAECLQNLLENKWKLNAGDKDRVVMIHEIEYEWNNKRYKLNAVLDLIGNENDTAMSFTVGLPLALAIESFIKKEWNITGIVTPVQKKLFHLLEQKLEENGINFNESTQEII